MGDFIWHLAKVEYGKGFVEWDVDLQFLHWMWEDCHFATLELGGNNVHKREVLVDGNTGGAGWDWIAVVVAVVVRVNVVLMRCTHSGCALCEGMYWSAAVDVVDVVDNVVHQGDNFVCSDEDVCISNEDAAIVDDDDDDGRCWGVDHGYSAHWIAVEMQFHE